MKAKSPKQQLNVIPNPEYVKKQKTAKDQTTQSKKIDDKNLQSSSSPSKRDELKKVQNQIEIMKNKVNLLKLQLQKEQQSVKLNKNKTEDVIKKKINVNKLQKYKQKDTSLDLQRAQMLRLRNASLRQAHQNEMQNIFKAIYLVKLDDARQIKSLSKSYQKKIVQINDQIWQKQMQKKKKVVEQSQKAKQKYQKYWKQKLASISDDQNKNKEELEKIVIEKKDYLKQLREQQVKLLQDMNKVQIKQIQSKKQYLAALSLPVKEVAQALSRSKSSLDNSASNYNKEYPQQTMNRMNSEIVRSKKSDSLTHNFSGINSLNDYMLKQLQSQKEKHNKVPNSTVNKEKLKIILKQLKRLEKKEKQQKN